MSLFGQMKSDADNQDPAHPRRYGLELAMGLTSAYIGGGIAAFVWPLVRLVGLISSEPYWALISLSIQFSVVAIILDLVLAKTGRRKSSGMLFPTTAIVLGGSIGFAGIALVINLLIFFLFGGI